MVGQQARTSCTQRPPPLKLYTPYVPISSATSHYNVDHSPNIETQIKREEKRRGKQNRDYIDARGPNKDKKDERKYKRRQDKTLHGGATGPEGTRTGKGAAAAAASPPPPPPPAGSLVVQFVFCGAESADLDSASAAFCAFVCSRSFLAVNPAV